MHVGSAGCGGCDHDCVASFRRTLGDQIGMGGKVAGRTCDVNWSDGAEKTLTGYICA